MMRDFYRRTFNPQPQQTIENDSTATSPCKKDARNYISVRVFSKPFAAEISHLTLEQAALDGKQRLIPSTYKCYLPNISAKLTIEAPLSNEPLPKSSPIQEKLDAEFEREMPKSLESGPSL